MSTLVLEESLDVRGTAAVAPGTTQGWTLCSSLCTVTAAAVRVLSACREAKPHSSRPSGVAAVQGEHLSSLEGREKSFYQRGP